MSGQVLEGGVFSIKKLHCSSPTMKNVFLDPRVSLLQRNLVPWGSSVIVARLFPRHSTLPVGFSPVPIILHVDESEMSPV